MTGNDTGLLVVTRGVASQFENLSGQVLEDGCEVDGRAWWMSDDCDQAAMSGERDSPAPTRCA